LSNSTLDIGISGIVYQVLFLQSVLNYAQKTMAAVLPSTYFGAGATAMQREDGDTRIYYQGADGAIYHTGGVGSAVSGAQYRRGVILVPAENVRFNTPLAVTAWDGFKEVNICYDV
jgi:hypothetical protein